MPKIILTVTNDLTYDQRMIRIASSLATAGYEVLLVGRRRATSVAIKKQVFEQKRLSCWFNQGKLFYLEYNTRLFLFLLFSRFDAVCSIDLDTILAGYYSSKIKRKICIYDAHEYFTEVPEVVNRPKVKAAWEWVAQRTIPNLNYCYTVCDSLQEVFEQKYGTPFSVIRNVPFAQPKAAWTTLPEGQQPIILLYQGALNDGRGLEEMITAMQQLEGVVFWLAGEGDLSESLRDLAKELNVTEKVKFWGFIAPQELQKLTQQAHIGINLLQNKGLNYYYSLANKFFDYMQLGKPSLNMNFPEYATINGQYPVSVLLDDLEIDTIVNAIQRLRVEPDLYQNLQTTCKEARAVFVWEKEEQKLLRFYQTIFSAK